MSNSWDWITEEFGRANARAESLPPWARPVVTRPVHARIPATPPLPPRKPLDFAKLRPDEEATQLSRDMSGRLQDQIAAARRNVHEAAAAQLERLRADGHDAWIEEGPMKFENEREGDRWVMRATTTVRFRWTGDGL